MSWVKLHVLFSCFGCHCLRSVSILDSAVSSAFYRCFLITSLVRDNSIVNHDTWLTVDGADNVS